MNETVEERLERENAEANWTPPVRSVCKRCEGQGFLTKPRLIECPACLGRGET